MEMAYMVVLLSQFTKKRPNLDGVILLSIKPDQIEVPS